MKPHRGYHGKFQNHQHPMWVIFVFLAIALGALVLILANNTGPDTGSGGTPAPPNAFECTRGEPEGFSLSDVEGKTLVEVESWAERKGWTVRVVAEDGKPLAATADYNPDRVNTQVEAGVVTRYCGNG
ncbi:MAG: hypothetical protein HYX29_02820 [Solirubrobacterales bacterium]|nr:hypothetical protein [Solirubrobacterales bacterium]